MKKTSNNAVIISHWLYFDTSEFRQLFKEQVTTDGFSVILEKQDDKQKKPYGIQIKRIDCPTEKSMTPVVQRLLTMALKLNGLYVGWESEPPKRRKANR
jgi:hypothetical protein